MGWWAWLRRRADVVFGKDSVDRELDDELRFHLEMEIRERVRSGMSPEDARREALIAFGGVERYKEQVRDARGGRLIDDWVQDTRVAIRAFSREPAVLGAVLATLALGIGGNVAMFGILDTALLRSLPYEDAERLVMGRVTYEGQLGNTVSAPDYYDYRESASTLASLAAYTPFTLQATLTGTGQAERVMAPLASYDLFQTLGVEPAAGRLFTPEEGEPGGASVVILSHGYWTRRYGGDSGVLGSTIIVDGAPATIVGVLPESFHFPQAADLWRPMVRGGLYAGARQFHNWVLVGRLADGVGLRAAQQEVDGISARLAQAYPDSNRDKGLRLSPLRSALAEGYAATVLLLSAAMLLLLFVACANVGGVLMARGSARRAELAIRTSLGAGAGRLFRQFLAEGAVLVAAATALGVVTARWLQGGMLTLLSLDGGARIEPSLSVPAVLAAVLVAGATVTAFGALPAAIGARAIEPGALRSRAGTAPRASARFRSALVVAQVTMTAVLLMMTGLLGRSLWRLYDVDTGFSAERLLTAEVHLPPAKYSDVTTRPDLYEALRSRITEIPGVTSVGLVNLLPVRDPQNNVRVALPAQWGQSGVFGTVAYQRMVLPGYFEAMGIPMISGRDVTPEDVRVAPKVMLVSASLAEEIFGEDDPLGRTLGVDVGEAEPWTAEVVGVVGDVTSATLTSEDRATMYFSYWQRSPASMRLAVRTAGEPTLVVGEVRKVLADLDPDVPLAGAAPMTDVIASSVADRRAVMVLLGTFAAVALLLAAVGLYGVLAYQVARRTREIGLRMALGASYAGVVRSVVRSGFSLVAIGLLLGVPASLLASRLIRTLLFEVGTSDPLTYLAAALFLGGVGAIACLLPARRAARVDPVVAFRSD